MFDFLLNMAHLAFANNNMWLKKQIPKLSNATFFLALCSFSFYTFYSSSSKKKTTKKKKKTLLFSLSLCTLFSFSLPLFVLYFLQ